MDRLKALQAWLTSRFLRDVDDVHGRKLVMLIFVTLLSCVGPLGFYVWLGMWLPVVSNSLVGLIAAASLTLLRRGVAVRHAAMVFLLGVLVVVAPLGIMSSGDLALLVFAWLTVYPLSASALGGPRVGAIVFAVMMVLFPTMVLLHHANVLPVLLDDARFSTAPTHVVMLTMMCFSTFLIGRGYEQENDRRLAQLDAQNRRLVEAQTAGEVASRARTQFLATISHELRTPLNGLVGMTAALRGEKRLERLEEGLSVIETSADALLSVINDVLDFTKVEAGALELERAPVAPAALARDVLEVLQARAREHHNVLSLEVAPGTADWMLGDAARLRQILFNLVGNATKFTEQGHVRCGVASVGASLVLTVTDDGVGMSPETLQRIGAPFVQADASISRKYGGTGLGLAITRRLAEAMGGRLDIESTLGHGSCFRVTVPCEVTAQPERPTRQRTQHAALEVLVVDDNAVNQLVAQRLLERIGHHVTLASDGQEAVDCVRRQRFDVVFMDCHMPVMDGLAATRLLRTEGFDLPIVALTAAVTSEDAAACEAAGMTEMLRKPMRLEQLEDALERLDRKSVTAQRPCA